MYNGESATINATEKQEAHENHEASLNLETVEQIKQQMIKASENDVNVFKDGCADDFSQAEASAEKDGLVIDMEDKNALQELGAEADVAKSELLSEIGDEKKVVEKANIMEVVKDKNFEGSIIIKTKNAEGRTIGYALRKNSQGNLDGNMIGYTEDGSIGPVYQLHEADFINLGQQGILDLYENALMQEKSSVVSNLDSGMEARVVEEARLLDEKEASKKFLAEERQSLAQEIREQRKLQRERLAALKTEIENANKNEDMQQRDTAYGKISEMLSRVANTIAEKFGLSKKIDEESIQEEKEDIAQLIDASDEAESIKARLKKHYAEADEIAQKKFESVRKTVEQTLIRNNAFIVHTFLLNEQLRHNANSNISSRATIEDDIDILLSLEPSISTSSVVPGSEHGLWNENIGVVIGGGDIRGGAQTDDQTQVGGIKERNGTISSSEEIDKIVSDKGARGYNELVVNNPKVFGFFKNVGVDEAGRMIGFDASDSDSENAERKDDFMKYINIAKQKGMPLLIMTPDRHLFEFLSIGDDGIVSIGEEITPEQVALGSAGLSSEKRKAIGAEVVSKNLFRKIDHQREAKGIVAELDNRNGSEADLSRDEYLAYLKDSGGIFNNFPNNLLEDKEFMMEAAQYNPVSAYFFSGEGLKRDLEFIKHLYSLEKKGDTTSIYANMPEDMRKDETMALIAIENGDFENLDYALADSPIMWEKMVDEIVEKNNPGKWFSRDVGEGEYLGTNFTMRQGKGNVDISDRLVADVNYVRKLNNRYPNFKFETNEYKQVLVTKLV
jgi:hypothetical protein